MTLVPALAEGWPVPSGPVDGSMDWQMPGAVGELLGAVGVVVTLGYLASQIRQSRVASQQTALAEVMDHNARFLAQLSTSPDMARLWRLGMEADQVLSVDEVVQFRSLLMILTYHWEHLYHLGLGGKVDDWLVASNELARRQLVGAPGFWMWFDAWRHTMSPEFRAALERDIGAASEYKLLGRAHGRVDQTALG